MFFHRKGEIRKCPKPSFTLLPFPAPPILNRTCASQLHFVASDPFHDETMERKGRPKL
jgi:hypothetical protein